MWTQDPSGVGASLRHRTVDLTRAGLSPGQADYHAAVAAWLATQITVTRGTQPCTLHSAASRGGGDGWVHSTLRWHCAAGEPHIRYDALFGQDGNHAHVARVGSPDGPTQTRILNAGDRTLALPRERPPAAGLGGWLRLGAEHILGAWDHLAFLLAMVLLVGRLGPLLWIVTGFTVAHSLTLAATVVGLALPRAATVELVIALSILLLALENEWRTRGGRWPLPIIAAMLGAGLLSGAFGPLMATGLALAIAAYAALIADRPAALAPRAAISFGFGLFHGMGFAAALRTPGLAERDLWQALLGFNLGVEAGQLAVLALAWPLLRWCQRSRPALLQLLNAGIAGLACYWLLLRMF